MRDWEAAVRLRGDMRAPPDGPPATRRDRARGPVCRAVPLLG